MESNWKIEYDNDTGPRDDSFKEWWTVIRAENDFMDEKSFQCSSLEDAEWLCEVLNLYR